MKSIRRQLTRSLLGAILLLLGSGLAATYWVAREAAVEQFDDTLHAKALAVSTLTRSTRDGTKLEFTDRFFRGFDDDEARDFFTLWDGNDRVIARSEAVPKGTELPLRIGKIDKPQRWNLTLPNGKPGRAVGFRFKPRGEGRDGVEVKLVVASVRDELDETLWELLGMFVACGMLIAVGTVLIIPRVLRRGLKPLAALGDEVTRIDAASLGQRLGSAPLPAELQPIAERLNSLLARLDESFQRERRFSADLAHELRTPLAELRSAAECAIKWPETRGPETDRETLAIALQMETLVGHLLALTRAERSQPGGELQSVPLEALLAEVWRSFAARAAERQLAVTFSEPGAAAGTAAVRADPALLRAILVNLCDNAVAYATGGGAVSFAIERAGDTVALHIANTTDELAEEDVGRLFDRFWRKDGARTGGQHLGLGLSLAQSFAQAMGWKLTARLEPADGRVVFSLIGPAA